MKRHTCSSPVGSLESVFLLATCYFRSGRVQQARHLLGQHRGTNNAKCDLLYARCCLQLNEYVHDLINLQEFPTKIRCTLLALVQSQEWSPGVARLALSGREQ